MGAPLKVLRLFADASGASCFDSFEIARDLRDFAPPALPLLASDVKTATGYAVLRLPVGWIGDRHPSPKRQILFCLAGKVRITADIGEPRTVAMGEAWMMEDTAGSGHTTEVISDVPFDAVVVQLPDAAS
jgi:quercetin dioxygenase-like cupin family protein